jgi:mannose-6-phosphate isomerase-like protein (cupin superfamily)
VVAVAVPRLHRRRRQGAGQRAGFLLLDPAVRARRDDSRAPPGENDTYVACLEGEGWTSIGDERAPLRAGEFTVWPKGVPHRLWTEGTTMMTLMYERVEAWRTTVTVRS